MALDSLSLILGFAGGILLALVLVLYTRKKPAVFKNLREDLETGKEGLDKIKKSLNNFDSLLKVMETNAPR